MAKVRFVANIKGFREVRLRDDAGDLTFKAASEIAAACGPGYVAERGVGRNRSRSSVIAVTKAAIEDNRKNNTILRNMGRGRW